jgi:hypothetical protein
MNTFAPFQTPILLITFNRPTHTRQVWEEIKKQHPSKMYIFQDGIREGYDSDYQKCKEVRDIFAESLDWDCELKTFYSEKNWGCGPGPATAISWFFQNEERGIIMEDDCLPSSSLFQFYADLLEQYKLDNRISLITANNLELCWKSKKSSYIFATVGAATMGSWASWARAWRHFDYNIPSWESKSSKELIKTHLKNKHYFNYYASIFDSNYNSNQTHIWDYQWFYARILQNTVSIVATQNQLSNIGFDQDGTHTKNPDDRIARLPIFNIQFPLRSHRLKIDRLFDWVVFNRYYNPKKKSFLKRIILKTIEYIYKR